MKIALCFFGQPRNVSEGFNYFNKFILEKYEVDTFAHLWNLNNESKETFISLYKPKKYLIEDQIQFDTSEYPGAYGIELIHREAYEKLFNSISQCYSFNAVNNLLSTEDGYDAVIKARTDTVIDRFELNLLESKLDKYIVPSHPSGFIYNDVIAVSNQKISNIVASRYNKLKSWYKEGILDFIPESLTFRVLKENNVEIHRDENIHCNIIIK